MSPVSSAVGLLGLSLLAACQPAETPLPDPALDFAENCASCHGPTGKGDGSLAVDLPKAPADLTRLAAANGGDALALQIQEVMSPEPDKEKLSGFLQ